MRNVKKPTISAVIAVKNEEKLIKECLGELDWVDEIVIVDMFSTDKTLEIAKKYTNKIYQCPGGLYGYIPFNQNFGIKKATKDWVLILDADVRVPENAKKEILEKIGKEDYNGYYVHHLCFAFGKILKSPFWYNMKQIKLFKKGTGYFEAKAAHELIKVKGKIGEIKNPFIHYTTPDIATFVRKANLYSSQDAQSMYHNGIGGLFWRKTKKIGLYQLIIEPQLYFFFLLFYKKNFIDGMHGVIISALWAISLFLERAKLGELQTKIGKA